MKIPQYGRVSDDRLKPCPFCGSSPQWTRNGKLYIIECTNVHCGAQLGFDGHGQSVVREAWNRRVE